ncbi:centromere protein X isoform X1 [Ochotona curzoniae]|uniref:centromere protein X isoform X1 n=1 Tax=Ochotona curzoniae TaxID=130825 RepID=UPI001B34885F|nr:centromere protein X isoform X1 [Ochotona curzoniae]
MEGSDTGFRKELVSKLLHLHFRDDKTRVGADALQLTAELLRVFVVEAAVRGVRQAQAEDVAQVDVEQLEKVLPQLICSPTAPGLLGVHWTSPLKPASEPTSAQPILQPVTMGHSGQPTGLPGWQMLEERPGPPVQALVACGHVASPQ